MSNKPMTISQGNLKKPKSVNAFSCSAYKNYCTSCFLNQKLDKEIALFFPRYTTLVKVIGKTDSFARLCSFSQQPHILAVWQMHFLCGVWEHCCFCSGRTEKCTVRSPLLSNTKICGKSFPRCGSGQLAQQSYPRSWGFISSTGSKRLRQAGH